MKKGKRRTHSRTALFAKPTTLNVHKHEDQMMSWAHGSPASFISIAFTLHSLSSVVQAKQSKIK